MLTNWGAMDRPRRGRAQAIVEFAITLPLTLILLLGMFDFGRAYVIGVAVQQGAREAARLGAMSSMGSVTDANIIQRFIAASKPAMQGGCATSPPSASGGTCTDSFGIAWTFTISPTGAPKASGAQLEVRANGNMPLFVGFLTGLFGFSNISLQGRAYFPVV